MTIPDKFWVKKSDANLSGEGWWCHAGGCYPVQGMGVVDGCRFYFRARGAGWTVDISLHPDLDPLDIDEETAGEMLSDIEKEEKEARRIKAIETAHADLEADDDVVLTAKREAEIQGDDDPAGVVYRGIDRRWPRAGMMELEEVGAILEACFGLFRASRRFGARTR